MVCVLCAGGIRHPLLTSLAGVGWTVARLKWATGYATPDEAGKYDPSNRYGASKWGFHIWTTYLAVLGTAISTGCGIAGLF